MEFESVQELINQVEQGNQAALGALGTKLARAMGEVGVLTDTDVVRYVQGQSWGRKLMDAAKKGAYGELSDDTLNDIRTNLSTLSEKLNKNVDKVYSNAGSRLKTAFPDLKDDEIQGLLGRISTTKEEKVDPKIEKYAKDNKLDYSKAKRILESRGYKGK